MNLQDEINLEILRFDLQEAFKRNEVKPLDKEQEDLIMEFLYLFVTRLPKFISKAKR